MPEVGSTNFVMTITPRREANIPSYRFLAHRTDSTILVINWFFAFLLLLNPVPPVFAEVQRFRLIPAESKVIARVNDPFGNSVSGTLRIRQGEARGDLSRLTDTASVDLTIDATSYDSDLGLRNQDILENHLEVKKHPRIRFASTGIVKTEMPGSASEPWLITLKGDIELHGVKREVVIPIRLLYQTNRLVAQGQFRFLLEDFKIAVPQLLFWPAGNEVAVEFRIIGEQRLEK